MRERNFMGKLSILIGLNDYIHENIYIMILRSTYISFACFLISGFFLTCFAQNSDDSFVYGDLLPDAPELSARGSYNVGVRTIDLVHKNQIDIISQTKGLDTIYYDRPLKIEVWYPTILDDDKQEIVTYNEVLGNAGSKDRPLIPFTFLGRASRDAKPELKDGAFPLIIVSHGYTGSRLLFTYLTENLASKGYVVVSIDHTDSTFRDAGPFPSTLLNRSLDDLFVLNEMDRLTTNKDSFLNGLIDTNNTGLVGFSMGGYGAINVVGAGYSQQAAGFFASMSNGSNAIQKRVHGNAAYEASIDPRIKAVVAFAPWGMERGVWDADGLAGIKVPSFFIAGSEDDISGYEKGTKAIYEGAVNSDRYLLTYMNARHNVAPNPPPKEALDTSLHIDEYLRYGDSVWDQRRLNNLNQHFVTAFLGIHLKNMETYKTYLDTEKNTEQKSWTGFKPRTSVGVELLESAAAQK